MNTSKLGRSIRAIRLIRGLTIEQLAEKIELDKYYLGRLEKGRRTFTLDVIQRIGAALNVNYAVLLLFSEMDDASLKEFSSPTFEHVYRGKRGKYEVAFSELVDAARWEIEP